MRTESGFAKISLLAYPTVPHRFGVDGLFELSRSFEPMPM